MPESSIARTLIEALTDEDLKLLRDRLGIEQQRRGYLNAEEAAAYLRISRSRLYQLTSTRRLEAHRAGRSLRFSTEQLDAYLAGR
jgi:excisionase family DNA binding protein